MAGEKTIIVDIGVPESTYAVLDKIASFLGTTVSVVCSSAVGNGLPLIIERMRYTHGTD